MTFTRWDRTARLGRKTISATGSREDRQRIAGVTLLEVLVAMTLILLLIGLAAVQFSGLDAEQTLTRPALAIQKLAEKARQTAMVEGHPVVLEIQSGAVLAGDRQVNLPNGFSLQLQRWGSANWASPGGYLWRFEPNGLCEPLGLRLTREDAYYEMTFNPLTAVADETSLWIP